MHKLILMRAGENLIWHSNVEHSPFSHKIILTLLLSYNLASNLFTLQVFATGLAASWSTQSIERSSVLPVENILVQFWHLMVEQDSPFLEVAVVWWWFGFQLLRRHIFAGQLMGVCTVLFLWEQHASPWNIVKWVHVLFVFAEAGFQVDETQSNWCRRSCVAKKCATMQRTHCYNAIFPQSSSRLCKFTIYCEIRAFCAPKKCTK